MTTLLATALRYAARGLPVFPLWPVLPLKERFICGCSKTIRCESPGKHPVSAVAPHGLKDATTDENIIRHFWASKPDANIAIATGSVVVLDIDPRHGGDRSLADLERAHGQLPPTWRVRTGGGGMHIYFTAPTGASVCNSAGKLGDGIDVRGRGGYVVAPPSRHISGRHYEWAAGKDVAPIPSWVVAAAQEPKQATTLATDWRNLVRNGVAEGKRNDAAARLAGHLLRRYVDPHVTLELVMAWNVSRCTPPLPPLEITTIVNSIAKRELTRREAS